MSKAISNQIDRYYPHFLEHLKNLIGMNTVYDNEQGIDDALDFCLNHFRTHLSSYNIFRDEEHNLLCLHKTIKHQEPVLYFGAHIDTVPADAHTWQIGAGPFIPYEDGDSIVGRRANDCKAGVAYQLFLAQLIAQYAPRSTNIAFTITRREEQGGTSAMAIAKAFGSTLPIGSKLYYLNLENTMRVSPPMLSLHYAEPATFGLEFSASVPAIRQFLLQNPYKWNPTSIRPLAGTLGDSAQHLVQAGGHAATVPRDKNILFHLLVREDAPCFAFQAGTSRGISVVPQEVLVAPADGQPAHIIVCDLRTFEQMKQVEHTLQDAGIAYKFVKAIDCAYDVQAKILEDEVYRHIEWLNHDALCIRVEPCEGTTDTSRMYSSASPAIRELMIPLTMGPGSRSQRDKQPPRLTHGPNKTYDKVSGKQALHWITWLIE